MGDVNLDGNNDLPEALNVRRDEKSISSKTYE
jgi:hypothetical protein